MVNYVLLEDLPQWKAELKCAMATNGVEFVVLITTIGECMKPQQCARS